MNIFGFLVFLRVKFPKTHQTFTRSQTFNFFNTFHPREFSPILIVNVYIFPFFSAMEYCLVKDHSSSDQLNFIYCPGMNFWSFSSFTWSSSVVGFRYVDSTIVPFISSSWYGINSHLLTQQSGQLQLSGISVNSVPGLMPLSKSQISGS